MRGNAKAAGAKVRKSNFNSRLYMRGNRCSFYFLEQKTKFQFTPLHERQRLSIRSAAKQCGLFQFTPLHERQRLQTKTWYLQSINFNSRLYMRGNSICFTCQIHVFVFQFTPLHERQRQSVPGGSIYHGISIHAST